MTAKIKSGLTKKVEDILQTLVWQPNINNNKTSPWFKKLEETCLCKSIDNNVFLNTPFDIELPYFVTRQMESVYQIDEEIGGIIFCKINFENNKCILKGEYFVEVANAIEDYYLDYNKTRSYFPEVICCEKCLIYNFNKTNIDEILFPIFVHTHPSAYKYSPESDVAWVAQRISEGDKGFARNAKIKLGNNYLLFFNAVFSGSRNKTDYRILYFGDKVTPFDFEDIKLNQVSKGIEDSANSLTSNEGLALFWQFALNVGKAFVDLKGTNTQKESIKKIFNDMVKNKMYFSKINEIGSTIVTIPKIN